MQSYPEQGTFKVTFTENHKISFMAESLFK